MAATLAVAQMARRKFPHLQIVARARNRRHVHLLMGVGVETIVRETFYSSLRMTELVMEKLDMPEAQALRAIELFRDHDEARLTDSYVFADDERKLLQTAQEANKELRDLFEADKSD